jgi:hypothetical protein
MTVFDGGFVQQVTFNYFNNKNESGRLLLRLFQKRAHHEWTLKLDGIPLSNQGQEVIIQFYTPDIDNNKTFYTDSNGLEMQERIIDYRPTWDFIGFLNVTQNYYPVNSAIVIKDAGASMS